MSMTQKAARVFIERHGLEWGHSVYRLGLFTELYTNDDGYHWYIKGPLDEVNTLLSVLD